MKQSATQEPDEHTTPVPQLVPLAWLVTVQLLVPLHVELAWHDAGAHVIGVPPQTPAVQRSL